MTARKLVRREDRPAGVVQPIQRMPLDPASGRRVKPPQPTILRHKTGRSLMYLVERGLVNWDGSGNFKEPKRYYRKRDPFTGEITSEKITDKSPTCGV